MCLCALTRPCAVRIRFTVVLRAAPVTSSNPSVYPLPTRKCPCGLSSLPARGQSGKTRMVGFTPPPPYFCTNNCWDVNVYMIILLYVLSEVVQVTTPIPDTTTSANRSPASLWEGTSSPFIRTGGMTLHFFLEQYNSVVEYFVSSSSCVDH